MDHKRQTDIFDPANFEDRHVTIVGLGNIGSHTAIALARMGIQNFDLYDFDTVEEHNLSSQAYDIEDIGQKKTEAIMNKIFAINPDAEVTIFNVDKQEEHGAFDGSQPIKDILVIGVDTMAAREEIGEKIQGTTIPVIDGRMGGGQVEVHFHTADKWPTSFVEHPDDDPCSARFISYTACIIGGMMANTVKRYLMGERTPYRVLMHTNTMEIIREYDD